jgi:hypothetical protein
VSAREASTVEDDQGGPAETVAGLMAAGAIAVGAVALVERPAVIAPSAIVVALVAAGIGGRHAALARWAVALCALWWFLGMTIAIATGSELY